MWTRTNIPEDEYSSKLPPIYRASTALDGGGYIWWCRLGHNHGLKYYRKFVEGHDNDGPIEHTDWIDFHFIANEAMAFMQYLPSTPYASCSLAPLTKAVKPGLIELVVSLIKCHIELPAEDDNYPLDFEVMGVVFPIKPQLN